MNRPAKTVPIGTPTARWDLNDEEKVAYVAERVPRWQRAYEAEQNPVFVWRAYALLREAGYELPTWVLDYFDRAAVNLHIVERRLERKAKKGAIAPGIAAAFGFTPGGVDVTFERELFPEAPISLRGPGGRHNPFADAAEIRELRLSEAVQIHLRLGNSVTQARALVASSAGVSVKTVTRALQKYPP